MDEYILSPDGTTVYRLVPEGVIAASSFDTSLLTNGYSATTGSAGTLSLTTYNAGFNQTAGGAQITALYDYGGTLGAGQSLQWIQVVTTNNPLGGAVSPYLDNAADTTQPFYSYTLQNRDNSLSANELNFYDYSTRPPGALATVGGPVNWSANLYPVVVDSASKALTVENGISWGWTEKSATVGTDTGTFINPTPDTATVTGVGTNTFTEGSADGNPDWAPSSLSFSGGSFDATVNQPFDLGTITYFNGTNVNGADSVTLSISVDLTNVPEKDFTLSVPMSIVNTTNTDDPIASADIVTLGSTGFSFDVEEGDTATADIYATLTTGLTGSVSGAGQDSLFSSDDTLGTNPSYGLEIVGLENVSAGGFVTSLTLTPASDSGTSQSDGITNVTTPTVTGTTVAGATVTLFDTDGVTVLGTAVAASDGTYTITSSALSPGLHSLSVGVTDTSGNALPNSATLAVTIDTTPPAAPTGLADSSIVGGVVNSANDSSTQTLTGSATAGETITIYEGSTKLGTATADSSGAWSYTLGHLGNGAYTLTATATDIAGNVSASSAALAFSVDTSAIAPTISSAAIAGNSWKLKGTAPTNATITFYDGSKRLGTATASATGAWSFKTKENESAVRDFTATTTDAAGTVSTASALFEGTQENDTFDFASGADLLGLAGIYGNGGSDAVDLTDAATLTDADFANVHGVHVLKLSGASSATLGAAADKAGIRAIKTGAGATSISDVFPKALEIGAAKLGATLTLAGTAKFTVAGLEQNLAAGAAIGKLAVTATGKAAQAIVLGSGADALTATHGGDTITGGGGADKFDVMGHRIADQFVYTATTDSLDKPSSFDTISGFADKGNGGKFDDVVDFSAISGITTFEGALAGPTAMVAADSVAFRYDVSLDETFVFANASASALSQTSASLMEIGLAGGDFHLAASNFKLG